MEKRYLRPDGSVRWAEVEVVAMWPEGDDPVWHMAIAQDVTERKRAEEALRESERSQKLILDHLPVGVILSSVGEERAVYQNPRFLELFGYSIEQFPTVADWWLIPTRRIENRSPRSGSDA
jgi:PAS domain-containing protein